jgi:hypothetical protein
LGLEGDGAAAGRQELAESSSGIKRMEKEEDSLIR